MHLHLEAQMRRVEGDSLLDVAHDVANVYRRHSSSFRDIQPSLLGSRSVACSARFRSWSLSGLRMARIAQTWPWSMPMESTRCTSSPVRTIRAGSPLTSAIFTRESGAARRAVEDKN